MSVLLPATAALLIGCGGDDGDADPEGAAAPPAGSKVVETRDLRLAVPSAWTVTGDPKAADAVIEVRPPGSSVDRAQVRAGSKRGYGDPIENATRLFVAETGVQRPGAKKTVERAVRVAGADAARRVEFTVPAGGQLAAAKIVTILALRDQTLINVSIGTSAGDRSVDPETILRTVVEK